MNNVMMKMKNRRKQGEARKCLLLQASNVHKANKSQFSIQTVNLKNARSRSASRVLILRTSGFGVERRELQIDVNVLTVQVECTV